MVDFSLYAGRWIGLTETGEVASVGQSPAAARNAARGSHPKAYLRLAWVSPHPPHLALPAWPLHEIRAILPESGVWLAGGPARDLLLGRPLHDWDFAVAGNAIRLARRVAEALDAAFYPLDKERDTGRVIATDPATQRPITLDFAGLRGQTIEADLRHRDFTINAMALTLDGHLLDPTGGQADLAARQIRLTYPRSFHDDPARLLRAVRQANALGFHLEHGTELALRSQAATIKTVAAERVLAELQHLISTPPATHGLQALHQLGLLHYVLPEIEELDAIRQSWPHQYNDVWTHTLAALAALEGLLALLKGQGRHRSVDHYARVPAWAWPDMQKTLAPHQTALLDYLEAEVNVEITRADLLKWGALFHDVGKHATSSVDAEGLIHFYGHEKAGVQRTQARLEALHVPNKSLRFVTTLVAEHMALVHLSQSPPPTRRAIYRFYRRTEAAGVGVVLVALADCMAVWGAKLERAHWRRQLETAHALLAAYFERQDEVVMPPPLLTGHDLMQMGLPQGPEIGRLLALLREAQACGDVVTRESALAFVAEHRA